MDSKNADPKAVNADPVSEPAPAPSATSVPAPNSLKDDTDDDDEDFWTKDDGGFVDRVKEDMIQSRAADTTNLSREKSKYRQLNRMMEQDHVVVDMQGASSEPPKSPMSPPGSVVSPASAAPSRPGTLSRSKTVLLTASLQPNVSSSDSATVMRRGSKGTLVTSGTGSTVAPKTPGGRRSSKPPPLSEARTKPNVGEVKDSFQWLDEDLEEKDPLDWDRKDTRCTRLLVKWRALPPLVQYLIENVVGMTVLLIPGIIDIAFFVENPAAYWANFVPKTDGNGNPIMTLGGYVVFIWSLWAAITFFVTTTLLYLVPYFPYVILRSTYLVLGAVPDDLPTTVVQFSRVLNKYIVWFFASFISSLTFAAMMPSPQGIGVDVSSLLVRTVGVSILWFGVKLYLAFFGRNFQRRIFQARVEANRFQIYVLERLYAGITQHLDRVPDPAAPATPELDTMKRENGGDSSQFIGYAYYKARPEAQRLAEDDTGPAAEIGNGGPNVPASAAPAPSQQSIPAAEGARDLASSPDPGAPADLPAPLPPKPQLLSTSKKEDGNETMAPIVKSMREALQVVLVGGEQVTEVAAEMQGIPLSSLKEAKMLARDLYVGLLDVRVHQEELYQKAVAEGKASGPPPVALARGIIGIEQFKPFFSSPVLAQKAFEIFDTNLNGQISRQEMKECVIDTYNTRVTLSKSMKDSLAAIGKLDGLVGSIAWVITILIYAGLFIDISEYIAAFAAFWAGFAFAFQNTIKNIVESIIFLFMTHPFDVGDRVMIDNESYFVKELGLMSTIFTHVDGREMYASNPQLAQKAIYNVFRSGGQTEIIDLRVALKTSTDQLKLLGQKLNEGIREKFMKDFHPDIEIYIIQVDWDAETMTIELWLNHRQNFQNGRQRWIRSTNFAKLLRHCVAEVGLEGGKMEVINLVGVSDWFAALMKGTGSNQSPKGGRGRMIPEEFHDVDAPLITVDEDDFEDDEEEQNRRVMLGD
ncbi:Mechanosensitive ion channel-domain-containing protein [Hyaloraphidium curvatum]|nr:Mechanosensitive ion channel-domain-containing protein [Hyaloraphidium curvatum]